MKPMEEKNTTNPSEKNEQQAKPKQQKKEEPKKSSSKWDDYKAEFRKIIWPKKEELAKKTVTVVFTSILIGAIIFCMDTVYTAGYDLLLSLLG